MSEEMMVKQTKSPPIIRNKRMRKLMVFFPEKRLGVKIFLIVFSDYFQGCLSCFRKNSSGLLFAA